MTKQRNRSIFTRIGTAVRTMLEQAAEERVEPYVARIEAEVVRRKKAFDFDVAARAVRLEEGDRELVAKLLYERFLRRCWRDAKISETEAELLAWLAGNVGLSKPTKAALHQKAAVEVFGATLAKAFEDGQIDESERRHLEHVAAAAGGSVGFLMSQFFDEEGEQFIRSLFTDIAAGARLTREDWKRFRQTTEWLGVPEDRVLAAIRDPAKHLVEHTLADARSDGEVTEKEERVIESLLETIIDDERFRAYVRDEIAEAKEEQDFARGLLPSVSAPEGIARRADMIFPKAHGPLRFGRSRSAGPIKRSSPAMTSRADVEYLVR